MFCPQGPQAGTTPSSLAHTVNSSGCWCHVCVLVNVNVTPLRGPPNSVSGPLGLTGQWINLGGLLSEPSGQQALAVRAGASGPSEI